MRKRNKYFLSALMIMGICMSGYNLVYSSTSFLEFKKMESLAGEVGDVVTSDIQEEIDGVKYPADGARITHTWNVMDNTHDLYDDGTFVVGGYGKMLEKYPLAWQNEKELIKTAIIKDGVLSISASAFDGAVNLTKTSISNSVTKIGSTAFQNCTELTKMVIPESVVEMGMGAFTNCINLKEINITYAYGGNGYIFNNTGLETVHIGKNVTKIDMLMFQNITTLKTVNISEGSITSIESNAFIGCSNLKDINFPSSINNIDSLAFKGCSSLEKVDLPSSLTNIGNQAFMGCSSLENANLPSRLTNIGNQAFMDCSLRSIHLPNTALTIGDNAFTNCKLTELTIPENTVSISYNAFNGNTGLVVLNYNSIKANFHGFQEKRIKKLNIGEKVEEIPSGMMVFERYLTQINNNNHILTKIGDNAFEGCTGLSEIIIPESVTSIGNKAFNKCVGINELNIPENVTSIGENAFSEIPNLKVLNLLGTINNNYRESQSPFQFSGLEVVNLGASCTKIPDSMFADQPKIKSIIIPDTVTSIGNSAFIRCTSLTSINIPYGVTFIGRSAFSNCDLIKEIDIPNTVLNNMDALINMAGLKKVTFNNKFNDAGLVLCTNLAKIYLLNGIDSTATKKMFPSTATIYCEEGSTVEGWCRNNNVAYKILTEEELEDIKNGKSPNIEYQSELFNKQIPADVIIKYSIGNGKLGAKGIKQVVVNNKVLQESNWSATIDTLTINKSVFEPLPNGEYKIYVEFDTGFLIDNKIKVTVIGDNVILPPEMTIPEQLKVVDLSALEDVSFTVYCDTIDLVILDTKQLKNTDYILMNKSLARMGSNNNPKILTIKKEALQGLQPGEHKLLIVTEGITIRDKLSIFISGNGTDITPPEAEEILTYYFYKDYQKNIFIPIKMNSATDIIKLKIGDTEIPKSEYTFQEGAIIINKDYLAKQPKGVYRLLPTFNDVRHTTIPNLVIELYDRFEDRLLPHLLPSYVEFNKSKALEVDEFEFKMFMGSGNSQAKSAKLLVIDGNFILPDGSIVPFKPGSDKLPELEAASPSEARYAAASPCNAEYDFEFFNDEIQSIYNNDSVFYTKGDVLYVNADFIKRLDLPLGEHKLGVIFDNHEETASLGKAILNIIDDNTNPEPPINPDEPEKPDPEKPDPGNPDPGNPDPGNPENPGDSGNPDNPNNGGGSSGGGSSSGGNTNGNGPGSACNFDLLENLTGTWQRDTIGWWYIKEDGTLPKGWIKVNNLVYYISPMTGYMHTGWLLDNTKWYYLEEANESGRLFKSEWLFWKNEWWYLQSCGQMKSNDWLLYREAWYYMSDNGHMVHGQWNEVKDLWYYMNTDGKMETKEIVWEGHKYFMDINGISTYTGPKY